MNIIDTHAHLDMPEFSEDLELVLSRAQTNSVNTIITIGINPESNLRAVNLADRFPGVYAGIGIHPQDSENVNEDDCLKLIEQARHPKVVAIGEIGLDFYREHASHEAQYRVLNWQLEAVKDIKKPVVIHCREAHPEFLPVISAWRKNISLPEKSVPGVLHCFNLDYETARPYLEMGFHVSIGAYIGYPSSAALRETVKKLPLERIMIETDCPFLPPQKMRGQRNEPAYCVFTNEVLASCRGMTPAEMAEITTANACRVFALPLCGEG